MSNFIYIMGKSSAGKDTIYQRLKDEILINTYVPYTTRPMREGERQAKEYHFVTKEQFEEFEQQNIVMERRDYNVINAQGEKDIWTYATIVDKQWEQEGDFLTIGTLESYTTILRYLQNHPEKKLNMLPVYIEISEEERKRRALERESKQQNPNYKELERRFKVDNIDFSEEKLKAAKITKKQIFENYDIEECIKNIVTYIQNERDKGLSLKEKYKIDVKTLEFKENKEQVLKQDKEEEMGISD